MQKLLIPLIAGLLTVSLTGCSTLKFPGVYRISIQQGNIVDQEMVDQLQPGMTRRQVRFVMGTPLVEDTFNPDRWDYFYSLRRGDGELIRKHIKLQFDGETLASIEGDLEPSIPPIEPDDVRDHLDDGPVEPEDPVEFPEQ